MLRATFNDDKTLDRETEKLKWLRPSAATKYFNMCRNSLDKLATACDAKKKISSRTVLYDVQKLDEYIKSI